MIVKSASPELGDWPTQAPPASCVCIQGWAQAACCDRRRCTRCALNPEPCFPCLRAGPGAGGLLRRLALYLFTPAVTSLLHTYGFSELPPQVPAPIFPHYFLSRTSSPCLHPSPDAEDYVLPMPSPFA